MKRYITYIAGITAAIMATSCMAFLQEDPKTFSSPENYYTNISEVESATNGCYAALGVNFRGLVAPGCNAWVMLDQLVGNSFRTLPGSAEDIGISLPVKETNSLIEYLWSDQYISIENCNSAIENITKCENVSEAEKAPYLGEIYFLRAYYYFNLVRQFGPVPYKVTPTAGVAGADLPCDSEADIYAGIVEDLKSAEKYLDGESWTNGIGRVRKGAVKSLLAKVYLTMAGYPLQKSECYKLAYEKALEVYNSKAYSLASDYDALRSLENSGEVVFSYQRADIDGYRSGLHQACLPFNEGVDIDGAEFGGTILPMAEFYASFDENDLRKQKFFYTECKGVTLKNVHIYKYWDAAAESSASHSGKDFNHIRYADVLLTLAEAKVMADGGNTTDASALDAFNQIRKRAGLAGESSLNFDTVFKERVYELCYESQTWYDMLRTRKAFRPVGAQVVDMIGYQALSHNKAFSAEDLYFPYPVRETRLNANLTR